MYSVGNVMNPTKDDPRFNDLDEAMEAAERKSINNMGQMVVAVWRDEFGEIIALFYEGLEFRS